MAGRKFFVGGNFKMNGSVSMINGIVKQINEAKFSGETGQSWISQNSHVDVVKNRYRLDFVLPGVAEISEVVVAPPALYLLDIQKQLKPPVSVSAQNCFTESSGAFTGTLSRRPMKHFLTSQVRYRQTS